MSSFPTNDEKFAKYSREKQTIKLLIFFYKTQY